MKNLFVISSIAIISMIFLFGFTQKQLFVNEPDNSNNTQTAISGEQLYQKNCSSCHGIERKGNPPAFPSLVSIDKKMSKSEINSLLNTGKNIMPSFVHLSEDERTAISGFLIGEKTESKTITELSPLEYGKNLFVANCASCHKTKPDDPQPTSVRNYGMQPAILGGINQSRSFNNFEKMLNMGPCYMPSFTSLNKKNKEEIYNYLSSIENVQNKYSNQSRSNCRMNCANR